MCAQNRSKKQEIDREKLLYFNSPQNRYVDKSQMREVRRIKSKLGPGPGRGLVRGRTGLWW